MADRIEKIWGTTQTLLATPLFELHRLVIKPRHRCSFHVHEAKHNAFFVIEGWLFIDSSLGRDDRTKDSVCLSRHDTYTVAPGIWHQFRTENGACVALEMYYLDKGGIEPLAEDIIRANIGGAT